MSNHTLIINRSESRCGNCRMGADPMQLHHDIILGYGLEDKKGCGQRFVFVTSHYIGNGVKEAVLKMRPDLEWIDFSYD